MSEKTTTVTIRVLDKEYQVACPTEERVALLESARYLDEKMREIRDSRKMIGSERVAVMAALNIAHDLLQCRADNGNSAGMDNKLRQLQNKVEAAISRGRQLKL
ncbi:MAG: cell division protein ZapA [Gammaproteobacteria bacterium]|nr:cell division protein ZapA [Gammaproteobacteria bacterium]MCF6363553.1 cell division protein ZapA [Gammaproteobacteria bacterium]